MKRVSQRNGEYYYSLWSYSLARVLSFERFSSYVKQLPQGDLVLDYGAGDRPYEQFLKTRFKRYISADYEVTSVKYAPGSALLLKGLEIPLESSTVDCVILTEVLEHVFEPRPLLGELRRVLTPNGYLVGTVPFAIQQHDEPYDFHRYTYYCLQKMFETEGFRIMHLEYIGDLFGVFLSSGATILDVVPKALKKAKLTPVAQFFEFFIRMPLFAYYYATKTPANPSRIKHFRRYPLGFSFCVQKLPAST